ncbi:MAG: hydrogenase 4 subunit B, partial [Gammaproteobacteria bacterium]
SRPVRRARPVPLGMRLAQGMLALLCLLAGILPTIVLQWLDAVPRQLLGEGLGEKAGQGWLWLTPVSSQAAAYSAPLILLALLAILGVAAWFLRRHGAHGVHHCDPWDCGFGDSLPTARMQYTATAFAQPIRRVFGALFQVDEGLEEDGRPRHRLQVGDRAWGLIYAPLARLVQAAARRVTVLQSGHVRGYLGWSLGTLLVLLWLIS